MRTHLHHGAVLLALLGSCGVPPPGSQGERATAIVLAAHANQLAPALSAADRDELRAQAADPDGDDAVVYVVAAGRPGFETVPLEPRRPNGRIERGAGVDRLVAERLAELDAAIARGAEQGTALDLLTAIGAAARTGAHRILVLDAGLTTTDPMDMRVVGWASDPGQFARDLRDRGLLPDLTGHQVEFSGLGRTAGAQPALGVREQALLRERWLAVCTAAGASCRADDSLRAAAPSPSTLATPVVGVLTVDTAPGPEEIETVAVPSSLLFGPDSCQFADVEAAAVTLGPLVSRLRSGGHVVAVSGRTAPDGTGDGVGLSTCRARAAATLLRERGVPADAIGEVRGDGCLLDPPSASQDAWGTPDPERFAALRRVVFTLVPRPEEAT